MCKTEIFADILGAVSKETEIPKERILSESKDAEVVDARYILVKLLTDTGMYPSQIASKINKTRRAVNYIISNFSNRETAGKMLRIYLDNIKKRLGNR